MTRIRIDDFGRLSDGGTVEAVTLEGEAIRVTLITYGAAIQALHVPDRDGAMADVIVGYEDLASRERKPQFFGASVGRYANRIAGAAFELDGERFELTANDGRNCLHGGPQGFSSRTWRIEETGEDPQPFVVMSLASPDGEGGFPGRLDARVRYELAGASALSITYEATSDRPTVVNLTNHAYFNLTGAGDILAHRVTVGSDTYLATDVQQIPTEMRAVAGTPFDFRHGRTFGERIRDADEQILRARGYDHCFALRAGTKAEPQPAARVEEEGSGRVLEILTTEPGLQVYSGNYLDATSAGKSGRPIRQSDAFCLEPQRFPDAPNRPDFPSARLDPGETYRHVSVYRFSSQ